MESVIVRIGDIKEPFLFLQPFIERGIAGRAQDEKLTQGWQACSHGLFSF
jgi:hypothetical protein